MNACAYNLLILLIVCLWFPSWTLRSPYRIPSSIKGIARACKRCRSVAVYSETPQSGGETKGFGKPKQSEDKADSKDEYDPGSKTYDMQSSRGVPEYNIFLRPANGTDAEWVPVGSMTIPRDASVAKAIFEVEPQLLKGTFKVFPKLKAFAEFRKDKENIFEYGYCLKAFPDEPIRMAVKEEEQENKNFFSNWITSITNPIDNSNLKNKGDITFKL